MARVVFDGFRWQGQDPFADFRGMPTFTLSQARFRWRNDDGSETAATWKANQNSNPVGNIVNDDIFRLRIGVQETGGAAGSGSHTVEFSINSTTNFTEVGSATAVRFATSAHVSNGTATTNQLSGTGTFVAGVVRSNSNAAVGVSYDGSGHTEIEWTLVCVGLNPSDVVRIRVTGVNTYSNTPTVTIPLPAPTEAPTISSVGKTHNTIECSWTTVTNATSYELQRKLTSQGAGSWNTIQHTAATGRNDFDLNAQTSYDYRVRGTNSAGEGPWSNVLTEVTQEAPPSLLPWHLIHHDFKGLSEAPEGWSTTGDVTVANDEITIGVGGVVASDTWNFARSWVMLEITDVPNTDDSLYTFVEVVFDHDATTIFIEIDEQNGDLLLHVNCNGFTDTFNYDPQAHRYIILGSSVNAFGVTEVVAFASGTGYGWTELLRNVAFWVDEEEIPAHIYIEMFSGDSNAVVKLQSINTPDTYTFNNLPGNPNGEWGSMAGRSTILRTDQGVLYVALHVRQIGATGGAGGVLTMWKSTDEGTTWEHMDPGGQPMRGYLDELNTSGGHRVDPQFGDFGAELDSEGVIHLSWLPGGHLAVGAGGYDTSTDRFILKENVILTEPDGFGEHSQTALAVDDNDGVHIAYLYFDDGAGGGIVDYVRKTGEYDSWDLHLVEDTQWSFETINVIEIAIAADGKPLIFYGHSGDLYVAVGNSSTPTGFTSHFIVDNYFSTFGMAGKTIDVVVHANGDVDLLYRNSSNQLSGIRHLASENWDTWETTQSSGRAAANLNAFIYDGTTYVLYINASFSGPVELNTFTGSGFGTHEVIFDPDPDVVFVVDARTRLRNSVGYDTHGLDYVYSIVQTDGDREFGNYQFDADEGERRVIPNDAGLADVVDRVAQARQDHTDDLGLTDVTEITTQHSRAISDDLGLNDDANRLSTRTKKETSDSGLDDTVARSVSHRRAVVDAVVLLDEHVETVSYAREEVDELALADQTQVGGLSHRREISDVVVAEDEVDRHVSYTQSKTDDQSLSDDVAYVHPQTHTRSIENSASLSDIASRRVDVVRKESEDVGTADQAVRVHDSAREEIDDLALEDQHQVGLTQGQLITDDLGVDDTITVVSNSSRVLDDEQALHDTIQFAHIRPGSHTRNLTDATALSDSTRQAADLTRDGVDAIGLDDEPKAQAQIHRVETDDLGLEDDVSERAAVSQAITSGLTLDDDVQVGQIHRREASDALSATDAVTRVHTGSRDRFDDLGITDHAEYTYQEAQAREFRDDLLVDDNATRVLGATRPLDDEVELDDTTSAHHIIRREISDSMAVSDNIALTVPGLYRRTVSENVGVEDQIARTSDGKREIADALDLDDQARGATSAHRVHADDLDLGDEAVSSTAATHRRVVSDEVGVTDTSRRSAFSRFVIDDAEELAEELAKLGGYRRTVDDLLLVEEDFIHPDFKAKDITLTWESMVREQRFRTLDRVRVFERMER